MNFPDSVAKYWAHHVDKFAFNPPLEVRRTCSVQMLAPALAGRWSPLTPRIIGWGIRFKLQMLCPQEDE